MSEGESTVALLAEQPPAQVSKRVRLWRRRERRSVIIPFVTVRLGIHV